MMVQSRWKNFLPLPLILLHYCIFSSTGLALASPESGDRDISSDRELVGLAEKWNLTDNGVDFGGLRFELAYITSDFILDNMATAVAYTRECKEGGVVIPQDDMNVTVVADDTPAGAGDSERDFAVQVLVNPANLETSSVYNITVDENGNQQAKVEFCMRFSLWTRSTLIEVNFLETIVGFTANLNAGFAIEDFNVQPKELLLTTAFEKFEVDAFQCDQNNNPLSALALSKAMNQGEIIRVCVTPTQDAQDEGLFMREIKSFTYYRDYGGAIGIVSQAAIVDSQAAPNYLTLLYCTPGDLVCVFETILFASMFMSPGFVEGTGTAVLQFGSNSRRLNAENRTQHRLLQGASTESQFDLDMEIVPGEPFNGKLRTSWKLRKSSSSKITVVSSFVTMGTIAILNSLI